MCISAEGQTQTSLGVEKSVVAQAPHVAAARRRAHRRVTPTTSHIPVILSQGPGQGRGGVAEERTQLGSDPDHNNNNNNEAFVRPSVERIGLAARSSRTSRSRRETREFAAASPRTRARVEKRLLPAIRRKKFSLQIEFGFLNAAPRLYWVSTVSGIIGSLRVEESENRRK